jgi:hypothetical protein
MTTLKTMILSVSAVAVWGTGGLYAQTKATADIPFEFTVQNTTLPAGSYTLSAQSTGHDLMVIRNVETRKAILVLAPSGESGYRSTRDKDVVRFHQVGGRYFLAEVKTGAVCGRVAPSKLERELSSNGSGQTMASVIVPALSVR